MSNSDPRDWATIWQSELAARAVDRDSQERAVSFAQAWEQAARRRQATRADEAAAGRASPDAPDGATAADAAHGAGGELERLRRRVAELEQRLADNA